MKQSIFSFLTSYVPTDKRESREDYLTQMFAWMLINIDGYVREYAEFLCGKNPDIKCPDREDIDPVISTQEVLPVGRIDLFIRLNDNISFICEHKVHSELSHNQIKKYMDNSHLLGSGDYYSVLVTYSTVQHTQPADVAITWSDVCEFTENILGKYEHEDAFVLQQFVKFLKENGMGKTEPIGMDALLGYWSAIELEYKLNGIFSQLECYDWEMECMDIRSFSKAGYNPKFTKRRWGRVGIDFFDSWNPGLFAGVLMDTADHKLQPANVKKGPDFVIFMESDYGKSEEKSAVYRSVIESEKYKKLVQKLSTDSGSFEFFPGIKESPWRVTVLRKPLYDILYNKYTREEQYQAMKDAIIEGLKLMLEDN